MTIEAIRRAHAAQPFTPFSMVLADGTRVPVKHPENLAHAGAGRTVVVFEKVEDYRVVDLLLVEAVEFGRPGAGRPRRPRGRQ